MNIKHKEVRKMTIKEMIKKYRLTLVGEDSVQAGNIKEARKNLSKLQAAKSEIIAELKAQKEAEENKLKEEKKNKHGKANRRTLKELVAAVLTGLSGGLSVFPEKVHFLSPSPSTRMKTRQVTLF